jgi:hypothetical protein
MTVKMIFSSMIFTPTNGPCCPTEARYLSLDLVPKVLAMTTSSISSEATKKNQVISTRTYSIMISLNRSGSMSEPSNQARCHVRGQITQWCSGMADSLFMAAMTARNGLVTCTSAVSRIRSTSGKRYRAMEYSHLTDLDTRLWYFRTRCSYLEGGMDMIQWMTFFNTVSFRITGMKSIVQTAHLPSHDTVTQPLSVATRSTYSVELIPTNKGSMTSTSSI